MFSIIKAHFALIKFTLSITVVFSAVVCYLLAPKVNFNWVAVGWLSLGGLFITGAANALNQLMEINTDSQMKRTAKRPLVTGILTQQYARYFSWTLLIVGVLILYFIFNPLCAIIALLSFFLYVEVYTRLKKINSIAVFVGGIPGALPCLIGWTAGNDSLSIAGWALFLLQFFWQFPHFWAIAWLAHEDYTKVGFKLLPSSGPPTKTTALQTILYCLLLIPIGMLPYVLKTSGLVSLLIILFCNLVLVTLACQLYIKMEKNYARRLMFASYIYLPIVLLALLFDKIIYL